MKSSHLILFSIFLLILKSNTAFSTDTTVDTTIVNTPYQLIISSESNTIRVPAGDSIIITGYDQNTTTSLNEIQTKQLDEFISNLKDNPNAVIRIDGHCDNTGTREQSDQRARDRAEAVNKYLREQGIEQQRIFRQGRGAISPLEPNNTPEGRAANRRVSIVILNK